MGRQGGGGKVTQICIEVAKMKNCCQVCLHDMTYLVPLAVRDSVMKNNPHQVNLPQTAAGSHYFFERKKREQQIVEDQAKANANLNAAAALTNGSRPRLPPPPPPPRPELILHPHIAALIPPPPPPLPVSGGISSYQEYRAPKGDAETLDDGSAASSSSDSSEDDENTHKIIKSESQVDHDGDDVNSGSRDDGTTSRSSSNSNNARKRKGPDPTANDGAQAAKRVKKNNAKT